MSIVIAQKNLFTFKANKSSLFQLNLITKFNHPIIILLSSHIKFPSLIGQHYTLHFEIKTKNLFKTL